MSNHTPKRIKSAPIGGKSGLKCKLYPNGEIVIYKPKAIAMEPLAKEPDRHLVEHKMARLRLHLTERSLEAAIAVTLGLSPLAIFDKIEELGERDVLKAIDGRAVKGLSGITPYGARVVRNAAHLIEKRGGNRCCVFATCTVPDLPIEQMQVVHERFAKVVEIYRLGLTRLLKANGLSGHSATVVEVQEKRYERTGVPVLHIHTVFNGRFPGQPWVVTTEKHDDLWRRAIKSVLLLDCPDVSSACNLQRVKKSTEGYIGKYMTKGSAVVKKMVADGFGGWLPKHWWSCSRELRRDIDRKTRRADTFAYWLNDAADSESADLWLWHRDVLLEMSDGYKITIARYGRLRPDLNECLHEYFESG